MSTGPQVPSNEKRVFLFLQGPHGPFFRQIASDLTRIGAKTWRVGFNKGDEVFWANKNSYIPHMTGHADWPEHLERILTDRGVTDVVLYGDTRPIHASAIKIARRRGLYLHVFEEGYLRPHWVTYENGGSNANSRMMDMTIAEMESNLGDLAATPDRIVDKWGDLKQHVFYGAIYHWFVMNFNRRYPGFSPHRNISVREEFILYIKRLALMPAHVVRRIIATSRIRNATFPYHVVLMQLAHDASFQHHSSYESATEFLREVLTEFAKGAPSHHHLVFKAHPLEDGRIKSSKEIRKMARELEISSRVHFILGGKLARLLDHAKSATTVNSTAGQQALWRGLPLKSLGRAIYSKPNLVSSQPLHAFFADPDAPDAEAYGIFRQYLLETSQIPGGFYSASARRILRRTITDRMLSAPAKSTTAHVEKAAARQHLRVVS